MELIRFDRLTAQYGGREIFENLSGTLRTGEKIAIVGRNGAGKSTLLRFLSGVEAPVSGTVIRAKSMTLRYLAQNVADESDATLDELVERTLARSSDEEYGLHKKRLQAVLDAFGFDETDRVRSLQTFSGGQRTKAALAQLLVDEPDIVVLDEPTNHLDVETIRRLENRIAADRRTYLLVSHDRYFIDRVATRVWEIESGRLHIYPPETPAYSRFLERRAERHERERRAYETYVTERDASRQAIADLRATRGSHDYAQVKSREKLFARLEAAEIAPPPPPRAAAAPVFAAGRRTSGGFVLEANDLSKAYRVPLFQKLDLDLGRGERLAVVGPNGAGKSTLLSVLAGETQSDTGSVRVNAAIRLAYYVQNARDRLDETKSAVDNVIELGGVTPHDARSLLGRMRLSGEAVDKNVRAFSGGERRRIMLAALMAKGADVLLLDEPTNDLDIESREALEAALAAFLGAIVVVSHDRYFLSRICQRVLWIADGKWGRADGGYDAYEALQHMRAEQAAPARSPQERRSGPVMTPRKQLDHARRDLAKLEREISQLEQRKTSIESAFLDETLYADAAQVKALTDERADVDARLAGAIHEWELLALRLESLETAGS